MVPFKKPLSIEDIINTLKIKTELPPDVAKRKVKGISSPSAPESDTIVFVFRNYPLERVQFIRGSIYILEEGCELTPPEDVCHIRIPFSYNLMRFILASWGRPFPPLRRGIEPYAFVHPEATIGKDVYIGAFSYIGKNARIGNNAQIYPHVYVGDEVEVGDGTIIFPGAVIYPMSRIGVNCIIHSGAVIGSDGFGFVPHRGEFLKIPHWGRVIIEDNVEIGANTAIDRAVLEETRIEKGVKLDNLIQVGHNVRIGAGTVIAALTGIAGSSSIGKNCMIGGQVGISDHISIADGVQIGAKSGVMESIKTAGARVLGIPAMPGYLYLKIISILKKLPEIVSHLRTKKVIEF